ncbi:DNA polymerase III subunit alpha [Larkinella insperata]|uniref:DNA polymerase III subunit alpha n=1 Tax=Larkinella insperata TaxID=332158 RepID=A0ABW3Q390_9BACT|nr:DNA polymerase III subunit alpha [Larkinella insperata]
MYLNVHSYFSLRYGTLSPEQLVHRAQALGIDCLALTDINTVSGVFEFVRLCRAAGIKPVVGVEVRNLGELLYVCLARSTDGFAEINRFLSDHLLTGRAFPLRAPQFQNAVVIYPLMRLDHLESLQAGEYVGVRASQVTQLWRYQKKLGTGQTVVLQPVTYADGIGFNLHKLLRCIAHNCLGSRLTEYETIATDEYLISPQQLMAAFSDRSQLLENSGKLLASCSFDFDFGAPKNRKLYTRSPADDTALLRKLAFDALPQRYGVRNLEAQRRVERELKIIEELDFTAYFLITWDIVQYAHSRGYFHVGRGSGANSIVAYCIGITDVDPIRLDLYFERFINPHRSSPPDFDLDFSWTDRDELTDYIFKKWGREHVCLMATYVTFRDRAAWRELGKVFGLPKAEIDALVLDPTNALNNPHSRLIARYAPLLEEFPNYLSVHAGGILISELPLYHYTALTMPPKGFALCQWDMYVAEEIGFAKWDILSQRGLGHIKEAVDLVRQNRQIHLDIHRIQDFVGDERIRRQLQQNETMGCFYIESPAMQQLIAKLRCADYPTLVAASSIIRPGVASSGMMDEYIRRHYNPASYVPLHPKMQELMADTYGVMIYQEDVIKVAHHFAGLTLAEADVLRRAMSGKYRSKGEFARIQEKFFTSCRERGYGEALITEVWRQIQSFGGYSFSKAHSASFAVESYQSLYLKTYFPIEFMCAVLNNFGGFYRTEFYVHEARRWGARIEAPDILQSEYNARVEGKTIWLGFVLLKGLEKKMVQQLLQQRSQQPFTDLEDFCKRVPAGLEQLIILIRAGVFRSFGLSKKELLWHAHALVNAYAQHEGVPELFELSETSWNLPSLWQDPLEDAYDEIELLGFSLCSPFELLAQPGGGSTARHLVEQVGRIVTLMGYLVTTKPLLAKNGQRMAFGYFVDREGRYFNTTHFPGSLARYPLRGGGIYQLEGKAVAEFGVVSLEVHRLERLPFKPDPRGGLGLYRYVG